MSAVAQSHLDDIGRGRSEVTTPALLLDLDAARRNIAAMAVEAGQLGTKLRPHVKSHKSADLARLQLEAGAIGLTCATVAELTAMAATGARDLFLANEIVDPAKVRAVALVARERAVMVAVDDPEHVATLAAAAAGADAEIGVIIEVDVGMGRAGVRSPAAAAALAELVARTPNLVLRGVHGYEGHCMAIEDAGTRDAAVREANARLVEVAESLGLLGTGVVTAGGTGTFRVTGAHPAVTDVQVGSYVLMDVSHARLVPETFELALTVAGTVVSRHGSSAVVDVGRKSVSVDFAAPIVVGRPDISVRVVNEEHSVFELGGDSLRLGERVELAAGYAPTTVNLHDVFHVVENGVVADIWRIVRR